jgi:hypothetical protein
MRCYRMMTEHKYLAREEMTLVEAWIHDMK